jgi:hypothetical protein
MVVVVATSFVIVPLLVNPKIIIAEANASIKIGVYCR